MAEQENKLYIGNLEYSTTEDEISDFFAEKGIKTKSVEVIKDKYTGKSKGFGFVEVESQEFVEKAIESADGQELKGRRLRVNKAKKPREGFDRRERKPGFDS
ncbi:MAG: RNA-binding protein [Candidatus Omnitrophica bacterium]|nr:RNA-binding protein [Candidatus Omnitrophota bacterium]